MTLEVTENMLIEDMSAASAALATLKAVGVRVALDDFGTGYSSLSYLQRLPLDTLKIDRSFVNGIGQARNNGAIVGMIVGLGAHLGLEIVAEGVEDAAQRAYLDGIGCHHMQGFHFARPLTAADASRLLGARLPFSAVRPG